MTLILAWRTNAGLCVLADTRISGGGEIQTDAGPKIFLTPIVINQWVDGQFETEKANRPTLGFAFAGSTLSAQSTHAIAVTCLQNLVARQPGEHPTVEDVAAFYARCGAQLVDERRSHRAVSGYEFAGVIFGRSALDETCEIFEVSVRIGQDGKAIGEYEKVVLDQTAPLYLLGSGQRAGLDLVNEALARGDLVQPGEILRKMVASPDLVDVGGHLQLAVSARDGVSLRPILRGGLNVSFKVLGLDIATLGHVGQFSPTACYASF